MPSAPPSEQMDYNHEPRHSIIRPVEPDHLPSPRINTSNQHPITNKVCWFFLSFPSSVTYAVVFFIGG